MASTEETIPSSMETTGSTRTTSRPLTPIMETESGPEDSTTIFHPDADLKVIVRSPNDNIAIYMGCASALACASPIWRSMLYHNAAHARDVKDETKRDQTQSMELKGDPEAIALLFRIIHYDFSHVPKKPTLDHLFELGKSACQYNCTHILYPWACQWTSQLANFVAEADCYSECHKALYVAWTFGELKLYRDMADVLIISAKKDLSGKVVNVTGQPLEDMLMPRDLLETIIDTRASTIAKIIDTVQTPIRALMQGGHGGYCRIGRDTEACEIMILGSVISALTNAGLYPVPEPEKFTDSIVNLKDKLDKVKTIPYVGKDWMPHMSHDNCSLGFRDAVMTCLKEMTFHAVSWMSNQAEICGIEAAVELQEWRQISNEPSPKCLEEHDLEFHPEKQAEQTLENASVGSAQEENLESQP
ncbi:hypothetical protein ONZ43_g5938 [Nemania bipapillata]|uniref:Uncharacterized protein n=1 Tax=Nemania bipapillata TaxID=110536 RepID=A0ACC2I5F3_9PEZI|nr:hypothetical protein ONZ43_g5938 [Nemania bipapillata]